MHLNFFLNKKKISILDIKKKKKIFTQDIVQKKESMSI